MQKVHCCLFPGGQYAEPILVRERMLQENNTHEKEGYAFPLNAK